MKPLSSAMVPFLTVYGEGLRDPYPLPTPGKGNSRIAQVPTLPTPSPRVRGGLPAGGEGRGVGGVRPQKTYPCKERGRG